MIKNNNCVTSYEGTASPGIVENLDLGIVTSEEKGGWQKSEGRAIHVKGRVGFCSAWQVGLSDAAGWIAHTPSLLLQGQL